MKHFKRPLIVTGIALLAALLIGVLGATWIHRSNLSNRKKSERSEMLGTGVGFATLIVVTPFWLGAAARYGKERRERRNPRD